MLYIQVKTLNPKSSHHKEGKFFKMLYLYEMMYVHWTYCGNHFIMDESQLIMLYALILYSAVIQLYLYKTGRKN